MTERAPNFVPCVNATFVFVLSKHPRKGKTKQTKNTKKQFFGFFGFKSILRNCSCRHIWKCRQDKTQYWRQEDENVSYSVLSIRMSRCEYFVHVKVYCLFFYLDKVCTSTHIHFVCCERERLNSKKKKEFEKEKGEGVKDKTEYNNNNNPNLTQTLTHYPYPNPNANH